MVLKDEDLGEQEAKLKKLEAELQTEPGYLALRRGDLSGPLEAAAAARDSGAALDVLQSRLSLALMPLKKWHGEPQPGPRPVGGCRKQMGGCRAERGRSGLVVGTGGDRQKLLVPAMGAGRYLEDRRLWRGLRLARSARPGCDPELRRRPGENGEAD